MSFFERVSNLFRGDGRRLRALEEDMKRDRESQHDKVMRLAQQVTRDLIDGAVADSLIADIDLRNSELRAVERVLWHLEQARQMDHAPHPAQLRSNWLLRIQSEIDNPISKTPSFQKRLQGLKWLVERDAPAAAQRPQRSIPITEQGQAARDHEPQDLAKKAEE